MQSCRLFCGDESVRAEPVEMACLEGYVSRVEYGFTGTPRWDIPPSEDGRSRYDRYWWVLDENFFDQQIHHRSRTYALHFTLLTYTIKHFTFLQSPKFTELVSAWGGVRVKIRHQVVWIARRFVSVSRSVEAQIRGTQRKYSEVDALTLVH